MVYYFINQCQNEGLYNMIKPLSDRIGGEIIKIESEIKVDQHGIVYKYDDDQSHHLLKEAKMKLMGRFLHSNEQFLWIIEDNVIPHQNFDLLFGKIKEFTEKNNPLIVHLGMDHEIITDDSQKIDEYFYHLPITEKTINSFATVYRRDIVKIILAMWRKNKMMPHDDKRKNIHLDENYIIHMAFQTGIFFMKYMLFTQYSIYDGFSKEHVVLSEPQQIVKKGYQEMIQPIPLITNHHMDKSFRRWYPYVRPCRDVPEGCNTFVVIPSRTVLIWNENIKMEDILSKPGKYPINMCMRCNKTKKIQPLKGEFVWVIVNGEQSLDIIKEPPIFISRTSCTEVFTSDHSVVIDELRFFKPDMAKVIMKKMIRAVVDIEGSTIVRTNIQKLKQKLEGIDSRFSVSTREQLLTVTLKVGGWSEKTPWRIVDQ